MSQRSHCLVCRIEVTPGTDANEACPTCGAPTRLGGRWRVIGPVARGGSARVFRGQDAQRQREVALKVLALADVDEWKQVELFERQLPLLRQLRHPGLPEVYDGLEVTTGGHHLLVLVQSLHRGPSLRDALAKGLRFDESSARAFFERMLDILAYLHGLSPPILHRDIKPANILLDAGPAADPEDLRALVQAQPVLIDFDTARGAAVDLAAADGTMVGSAGYVPLEQLAGRPVPASDVYALGMTMIAALSHRDLLEIPVKRSRLQFEPFVQVSASFREVLAAMIEPVVEDRLPDVAAVRRALARGDAPPRRAPQDVHAAPPRRHPRRRPAWAAGAVALVGIIGGTAVFMGSSDETPAPSRAPAPVPAEASRSVPEASSPGSEIPTFRSSSGKLSAVPEACRAVFDVPCEAALRTGGGSFGRSLALGPDTLVIGEPSGGIGAPNGAASGVVHILVRRGSSWIPEASIDAPGAPADMQFGWSVALDGDTVAVGARFGLERAGAVEVYRRDGSQWRHQAQLAGTSAGKEKETKWFGNGIALRGGTLVAREQYPMEHRRFASAIRLFVRDAETWTEAATIRDYYGDPSLAVDGDTLVLGALFGVGEDPTTAVDIYARESDGWIRRHRLTPPEELRGFGRRLTLDGDTLAFTVPQVPRPARPDDPQAVHVYTRAGDGWAQQAELLPSGPATARGFGRAIALHGDRLAVLREDDPRDDRRPTVVFLYRRTGDAWTLEREIEAGPATGAELALHDDTLVFTAQRLVPDDTGRWRSTVFVLRL